MNVISIDAKTKVYGVIGHPVSHSFSPKMQTEAFFHTGINAVYLPFDIPENQIGDVLPAFRLLGVQGFNITVPFKEKIIPFLDEISPEAERLGSVNTVCLSSTGWKGYSTDGEGLIRSLHKAGLELPGKKVLLLGAGGSAKAIAASLAEKKISHLIIQNRTVEKADQLANAIAKWYPSLKIDVNPSSEEEYDILINSTSAGMKERVCPVEKKVIYSSKFVVDIIYNPSLTPLLELAIHKGIPYLNGLGMLLYQGAAAFELWTKVPAPTEIMENVLHSLLSTSK